MSTQDILPRIFRLRLRYELQRRLEGTEYSDISVLAVDPGAMPNTSLIRESSWFLRFMVHWIAGAITPLLTYLVYVPEALTSLHSLRL